MARQGKVEACPETKSVVPFDFEIGWKDPRMRRGLAPYLLHANILWGGSYTAWSAGVPPLLAIPAALTAAYPFHTLSLRLALEKSEMAMLDAFDMIMTRHGGWNSCMAGYPIYMLRNCACMLPLALWFNK